MHENRETSETSEENVGRRTAGEGSGHTSNGQFKPADAENLHDVHLVEAVEKTCSTHCRTQPAYFLTTAFYGKVVRHLQSKHSVSRQSGEPTLLIWRELASADELHRISEEQRS